MKTVELGTLASISTGKSNVVDATNTGKYPFYDRSQVVKRSNRYLFDVPSAIIVPGEGTSFIPRLAHGKFDLHQRAYAVIPNEKAHAEYLYYAILNAHKYFLMVSAGSTVPSLRLGMFEHMPILLPPLPEQKRIAGVLGAIDEKIEVNRAKINSLSLLAQSIYDYWFVQFDFPNENGKPYKSSNGKLAFNPTLKRYIPINWDLGKLGTLITVCGGKDHKHLADGPYPVLGSGGVMRYACNFLYDKESVLVPRKGTLNNVMFMQRPFWTVDTMFYTTPKKVGWMKYVFMAIKDFDFARLNTGTGVPSMTSSIIQDIKVVLPPNELVKRFEDIVAPIFERILALREEVRSLEGMRDELLPLLMNGQLQILTSK